MSFSRINASAATLTKNRTEGSIVPASGMCVTCVDGCIGMCEIGKSAYRGHEVIYPQPFGIITAACEKSYCAWTGRPKRRRAPSRALPVSPGE